MSECIASPPSSDAVYNDDHELVVSMGAGDIGELVESIKKTIIDQNES